MEVLSALSLGPGRRLRLLAGLAAPFSGRWHPAPLTLTVNLGNVEPGVYRRFLANGVEDLQPGVVSQFAALARDGTFRSADGRTDYGALFFGCRQPALFVSAGRDGLTPPPAVEAGFQAWGGPKRLWILGDGYGHVDLLYGRSAPEEVFPGIRDFLLEASASLPGEAARP